MRLLNYFKVCVLLACLLPFNAMSDCGGDDLGGMDNCMEEVKVIGVRIVTNSTTFFFFHAIGMGYFFPLDASLAATSDNIGDETQKAVDDENAPYATCDSSVQDRYLHALTDVRRVPANWRRVAPIRVKYSNGDTELWQLTSPYLSSPITDVPIPGTCMKK